jgi:VanZ family protein
MASLRRLIISYLPGAAWAVVIALIAGATTLPPTPGGVPFADKLGHFGVYFVLGCLLGWGWLRAGRWPHMGLLLLFAALLGISDELRHAHMPNRTAELADWFADMAGAAAGLFLSTRLLRGRYDRAGRRGRRAAMTDGDHD